MENLEIEWLNSKFHGDLEGLKYYVIYDGMPVTFSAKNEKDELFWCYSLGLNEEKDAEMYLVIPISCDNLARFEANHISYLDMLTKQQIMNTLLYWKFDNTFEEMQVKADKMPFLLPKQNIYLR